MTKLRSTINLNVFLNKRHVGRIQRQSNGAIEFSYDNSWLNYENALPISLSLPLSPGKYLGPKINAVLDNLLPDNDRIRHQIAIKVGAKSDQVVDLLAAIGHDCVGALRFIVDNSKYEEDNSIQGKPISDNEIANRIKNLAHAPLGLDDSDEFRISLAGAQEKTAFLYHDNQWMTPLGSTPTTHIFKPQIGQLKNGIDLSQSIENEHFCLEFITNIGLPCANSKIEMFADEKVLVVERFDRLLTKDGRLLRLPQEDFCQAFSLSSSQKYEKDGGPGITSILNLLSASDEALFDKQTFFKAQIVYWLLAATDAHAKNYSIALFPHGRFHLTPLYDVMSVQPYFDRGQIRLNKIKMAMALGKKRHYTINEIMPRHFIETGVINGFSEVSIKSIFDELRAAIPIALEKTQNDLSHLVPTNMIESIVNGVNKRLSLLNFD